MKTWELPQEPTDSEEVFDRNRERWLPHTPGQWIRERDQKVFSWQELVYSGGPICSEPPKRRWFKENLPPGPDDCAFLIDISGEVWTRQDRHSYNRQRFPLARHVTFAELVVLFGPIVEG